jgi:hypothetical protein
MRRLLKKHENPQARILAERSVFGRGDQLRASASSPNARTKGLVACMHGTRQTL